MKVEYEFKFARTEMSIIRYMAGYMYVYTERKEEKCKAE